MSLLKCPECGKKISEFATACPYCGCPKGLFSNNQETAFNQNVLINFLIKTSGSQDIFCVKAIIYKNNCQIGETNDISIDDNESIAFQLKINGDFDRIDLLYEEHLQTKKYTININQYNKLNKFGFCFTEKPCIGDKETYVGVYTFNHPLLEFREINFDEINATEIIDINLSYLFCSVIFLDNEYSKRYYYLLNDKNANVNDFATVNVEGNNTEKLVKIVEIKEYKNAKECPYSPQKCKQVLRVLTNSYPDMFFIYNYFMQNIKKLLDVQKITNLRNYINFIFSDIQTLVNNGFTQAKPFFDVSEKILYSDYNKNNIPIYKKNNYIDTEETTNIDYDDYDETWTDSDWKDYTGGETMDEFFDHEDD